MNNPFAARETEDDWREQALCAQTDPDAFFPEKGGSTRDAKAICASCDVTAQCLAYALENGERFGVWGGMSERDRRRLQRTPQERPRKKACVHGHAYTPENTRITRKGTLRCRACDRIDAVRRRRMSAPKPTLMEQATIDRMGIFDDEKFAEITAGVDQ